MMINVLPDEDALAVAAADHVVQLLEQALARRQRATLVLTGGRTPEWMYRAIAERHARRLEWGRVAFFLGDERFVPPDHAESNFGRARQALLAHLDAAGGEVYPYPTTLESPQEAADAYELNLRAFFGDETPAFDVMLLGLGADGHVASLFPGSRHLDEYDRWVIPTRAPAGMPVENRLTMTFPLLNAGRNTIFLVATEAKAETVARVLRGDDLPANRIRPRHGDVIWYLDEAAASRLET